MENDWIELNIKQPPAPPPNSLGHTSPAICTAFDTQQELIWTGDEYGLVASSDGPSLSRYTSFRAHKDEGPVKQLLLGERGVISISAKSVHLSNRRGVTQWHLKDDSFKDLRCMSFTAKGGQEILVAGYQNTMYKIAMDKGTITEMIPTNAQYSIMKKAGQYMFAATGNGLVHVLDPESCRLVKDWHAHNGWINDMDANPGFLVTCGGSRRAHGNFQMDLMAMVFDTKTLAQLPPIPFPTGAAFVRMHPRMQTTAILASQQGQLQVVDIMNPHSVNLKQVGLYDSYLAALEMSSSGEAILLTDTQLNLRLWGSPTKCHFVDYSNPIEYSDPEDLSQQPLLDFSYDQPLSTIGLPPYRETLLSAWPGHLISEVGAPAPKIEEKILLQALTSKGWAANPKTKLRNQIEDTRQSLATSESMVAPQFLHQKDKNKTAASVIGERRKSETFEALADRLNGNMYAPVDIKYSKFGIDDYDFKFWNDTPFAGLETHIVNSYANPLLQLFRFIPWVRNLALRHTASSCLADNCLLCQLGYLIDMLEKTTAPNCHPSNFLKTLEMLSDARNSQILEQDSANRTLNGMIQALNRFLIQKFTDDYRKINPHDTLMDNILATGVEELKTCVVCKNRSLPPKREEHRVLSHELTYKRSAGRGTLPLRFAIVLKESLETRSGNRGWCNTCRRYQQLEVQKRIKEIPPVLLLNVNAVSQEVKTLWATPKWLPQEIGIIINHGQVFCYEGADLEWHLGKGTHNINVYELIGVVCDVSHLPTHKQHLVSVINVGPASPVEGTQNQWYLFNDHHVRKVPVEEALRFDAQWKVPAVLAYQSKAARHQIDDTWKDNLDTSLLFREWSLRRQELDRTKYRTLSPNVEQPRPGMPVAIDAEFVTVRKEEIEVTAKGETEILRPKRQALARVSVLRGDGLDEGLPFIDDYIAASEPIVDYITAFSGINPGDLDPATSPFSPVPLKVIYKKLWLLLNLGCVFIGHGLIKDFRTINIHVPKAQVVDTVEKFFLPAYKRKLGLKFLSMYVLGEEIQNDDTLGHDSIEDAHMALRLWRKWQEWEDAGIEDVRLSELYREGEKSGFRVGARPGTSAGTTDGIGTPERASRAGTPADTPGMMTPKRSIIGNGTGVARELFGSPLKRPG